MTEPPTPTQYNFLSLGAGVQSSCLALMAAHGEITPMPDAAIFADTQAEPKAVYDWLDWLEKQLPYPIYRVTNGSLTLASLQPHIRKKSTDKYAAGGTLMKRLIPVFGIKENGDITAAIGRKCTADYKIKPITKLVKQLANIKRGQKEITVTQWIGISWDERIRVKDSQLPWSQHRWPLLEKRMLRGHCLEWMQKNNYPSPPRSACVYCPFHSDEEWRKLRNEDPEDFQKALQFDKDIRAVYEQYEEMLKMKIYLHRSCKPLDEIDFDNEEDKGQMVFDFNSECEGMCGV